MLKKILLRLTHILPDSLYLKLRFRMNLGKRLNLKKPQTFNEKTQWLKIYDHRPEYTDMVCKVESKNYFAKRYGEEYIIPTLGVWDNFDDIDFDALPDQFVLKVTHDSGGVVICKDKSKLDIAAARKKLQPRLKQNYYWHAREWPYKGIKPRIIAEQFMGDGLKPLVDYKFMCFNGEVKVILICTDRFRPEGVRVTFYDLDWNILPFKINHDTDPVKVEKPANYDLMFKMAEEMSKDIPFLRVDFYEIDGKVYFGEFTFFTESGLEPITPYEWDEKLGDWIKLPPKTR